MKNLAAQSASSASKIQRSMRKHGVWLTILTLLASSWSAWAQSKLDIKLSSGGASWEWQPSIISDGAGGYKINNVNYFPAGAEVDCYNMTVGYDPFISASVDVVNNTASTQIYTLIFTLPISPAITGASRMGGSTQGGLTDANGNGIGTLSTIGPGTALYYGQIDGVNVLQLFPDLKTMNVPFAGGSTSDSTSAGLPGVTIPGPNANTSIGIEHQFSLTPGDRATFTSFFRVEPVPEPAGLSLLALGGMFLVCRRRR